MSGAARCALHNVQMRKCADMQLEEPVIARSSKGLPGATKQSLDNVQMVNVQMCSWRDPSLRGAARACLGRRSNPLIMCNPHFTFYFSISFQTVLFHPSGFAGTVFLNRILSENSPDISVYTLFPGTSNRTFSKVRLRVSVSVIRES